MTWTPEQARRRRLPKREYKRKAAYTQLHYVRTLTRGSEGWTCFCRIEHDPRLARVVADQLLELDDIVRVEVIARTRLLRREGVAAVRAAELQAAAAWHPLIEVEPVLHAARRQLERPTTGALYALHDVARAVKALEQEIARCKPADMERLVDNLGLDEDLIHKVMHGAPLRFTLY